MIEQHGAAGRGIQQEAERPFAIYENIGGDAAIAANAIGQIAGFCTSSQSRESQCQNDNSTARHLGPFGPIRRTYFITGCEISGLFPAQLCYKAAMPLRNTL